MRRSFEGLLDRALPEDQLRVLNGILDRYRGQGLDFHALRTSQAGARSFVTLHVLVPAEWTVAQGHRLAHKVEDDIRAAVPGIAEHIKKFWDPRMRKAIFAHLDGGGSGLDPAVRDALRSLKVPSG